MSIWSLTYQQSIFKRYHTDRHFSEFLPTRWRQKSTGIDMEQNYVAVTLSIISSPVLFAGHRTDCAQLYFETHSKISRRQFGLNECCSWSGSSCHSSICRLPVSPTLPYCDVLLKKGSPYSITERRVPELIPVLGSQPAGDVSHKPGARLPLLSARRAFTPATLKRAATNFAAWWTEAQWVWRVCLRLLPDSVAAAIWTRALLRLSPAR